MSTDVHSNLDEEDGRITGFRRTPKPMTPEELEEYRQLMLKVMPAIREMYRREEFIWMYAIQQGDDGPIKLGVTKSPRERIATLQQGNPTELRGIAAWRALSFEEKFYHREFAMFRIRGEWFEPHPELVDQVLLRGADFEDWK